MAVVSAVDEEGGGSAITEMAGSPGRTTSAQVVTN